MTWVSPSYAAHEARKAGFKHSHDHAVRIMRAHGHFKDKIKRRSDHRDLVDLDAYLEVAKYISTEREKRKQQAADARQQVEEGRLAELEREIKAARKWAADADIERQAAVTECERLRKIVASLSESLRMLDAAGYENSSGAQLKQEGKAND